MSETKKFDGIGFTAAIEREKKIIGEARDRLRDLIVDATEIADNAEDAYESLTYAINRLSEYV